MPTVKEWRCLAHGPFEGPIGECPYGCKGTVHREFRTPPAFRSERTGNIDSTLANLAARHGMSDISNRGGAAAKRMSGAQEAQRKDLATMIHERYGDGWGKIAKGGTMNVKTKEVTGGGAGAPASLAQYGGHADNALDEVKPAFRPIGERTLVRRDHENFRVTKTGDITKDAA